MDARQRDFERALGASEAKLRAFLDHSPSMIFIKDVEGRYEYVNRWFCEAFHLAPETILGRTDAEVFLPETAAIYRGNDLRVIAARRSIEFEETARHDDGVHISIATKFPVLDARGDVIATAGIITDITERKRVEQSLRDSAEYLRMTLEAAQAGIWVFEVATRTVCWDERNHELHGLPSDQAPSHAAWLARLASDDRARMESHFGSLLRDGGTDFWSHEYCVEHPRLGRRWLHGAGRVRRDGAGRAVRISGINIDVTEHRKISEAFRERNALLQTILDSATDFIFLKDRSGRYVVMNGAGARSLGRTVEQIVGSDDFALFSPLDAAAIRERDLHVMESGVAETFEEGYPDRGELRHLLTTKSPCRDESGQVFGVVGIARDITERKVAEESLRQLNEELERRVAERTESLRESRERLRAVVDAASDAIVTIDERGVITAANPATERMFGYSGVELLGANVSLLMPSPYRENHDGYVARYLQTGVPRILGTRLEVQGRRRDGSLFPIELAVSEVADFRSFTGILRDVSRRKALEKQVVETGAQEEQRLARELHDSLGQELTGLGLMAGALTRRLESGAAEDRRLAAKLAEGLDRARQGLRRVCHELIVPELDPEGLRAALEELAERASEQAGVDCLCVFEAPFEPPDPITSRHLYRIAQEAVANALRHGRARRIRLELAAEPDGLRLSIQDDGVGLPADPPPGAGVGIPIMRYRAGMIGGLLLVSSRPSGGTMVTCTIPARSAEWNPSDADR